MTAVLDRRGRLRRAGAPARTLVTRLALAALAVAAISAQGQPDEREALAAERRRIEAGFATEEAACAHRFTVNACVEDVAERRRAALAPLRGRELALDEAERRARAAERQRAVQERQQAAAERVPAASAPAAAASDARSPPAKPRREVAEPARAGSAPVADAAAREREAAERAAAAQLRAERARATQERIEKREAERARSGKAAQPLPVPASAARP
jgi:colicin import membrane protein